MSDPRSSAYLSDWKTKEALAEAIVPLGGRLYREQACVAMVFGTSLVQKSPIQIIQIFDDASHRAGLSLSLAHTVALLERLVASKVGRARVDLGRLLVRFAGSGATELGPWAAEALAPLEQTAQALPAQPQDVVLYGFGRIGRLIARILINKTGGGDKYRLRAIVLRKPKAPDLSKRASLLRRDSVHGIFPGTIALDKDENGIVANGNLIRVLYADAPEEVDYAAHGIRDAIVIDNTGKWRDREGLGRHLRAPGVGKVILTAPGKGDIPNIVYGVNDDRIDPDERIFSAASCTTNAVVPVLKALDDRYGIVRGHLETIHAYTNDQNLIDNYHPKPRRGRGAAMNMVITTTGAANAAAKALPSLAGKLTGNAIRVPTPNVSLAILHLQLGEATTVDALNDHLLETSLDSPLHAQIGYSRSAEVVSTDLVGDHHAGTVDAKATITSGTSCVVYVWYDNEFGYSCQVVRMLQHIAGVAARVFPPRGG